MKEITEEILVPLSISVVQQVLNVLSAGIHPAHPKQFIDNLCQTLVNEGNKAIELKKTGEVNPNEEKK